MKNLDQFRERMTVYLKNRYSAHFHINVKLFRNQTAYKRVKNHTRNNNFFLAETLSDLTLWVSPEMECMFLFKGDEMVKYVCFDEWQGGIVFEGKLIVNAFTNDLNDKYFWN